jgi:hypothetical protein
MSSRDTKTYTVPDGFPELLKDFAREVRSSTTASASRSAASESLKKPSPLIPNPNKSRSTR